MTVTPNNLTTGTGVHSSGAVTTASVAPGANRLVIIAITTVYTGNNPTGTLYSVAGNGLTWHEKQTVQFPNASSNRALAIYYSMGASPSAGTIVLTTANGGPTAIDGSWCVLEFSGAITTGTDGADATGTAAVGRRASDAAALNVGAANSAPGANGEIYFGAMGSEDGSTTPHINNLSWAVQQFSAAGNNTRTAIGLNTVLDADTASWDDFDGAAGGISFQIFAPAAAGGGRMTGDALTSGRLLRRPQLVKASHRSMMGWTARRGLLVPDRRLAA